MRKVIVYGREYDEKINAYKKVRIHTGMFHQWGMASEEAYGRFINSSAAIVELEDGKIITPEANMIQFVKDHDKE